MIKEIIGDLIKDGRGILCHQVNYHGVMGGGIALTIQQKMLTEEQYRGYQEYCFLMGKSALGTVYWIDSGGRKIANIFSQGDFSKAGDITDYNAMETCFRAVGERAREHQIPVSIPGYIGCGIAGGDWGKVKEIINQIFNIEYADVDTTIVYWEKHFMMTQA